MVMSQFRATYIERKINALERSYHVSESAYDYYLILEGLEAAAGGKKSPKIKVDILFHPFFVKVTNSLAAPHQKLLGEGEETF